MAWSWEGAMSGAGAGASLGSSFGGYGAVIGGVGGAALGGFMGGEEEGGGVGGAGLNLPGFYEDPYYKPSQDLLFGKGSNLLEGRPDPYYAALGETGSKEFQDISQLVTRDIQRSGEESAARLGIRGPSALASINRNVADTSKKMKFQDYLRSLEGKKFLFGQGRGMTEGVRGASLNMTNMRNQFSLAKSGLGFGMSTSGRDFAAKQEGIEGDYLSDILGSSAETLGTIYGKGGLDFTSGMGDNLFADDMDRGSTMFDPSGGSFLDKGGAEAFDKLFYNPTAGYGK